MDDRTCYCRRAGCASYGQVSSGMGLKFRCWHRQAVRYAFPICGQLIPARTGTTYIGMRTDLPTYLRGATALAEGLSIRATGRLLEVDKDTVNQWLPSKGRHCQGVMNYSLRDLHLTKCQLDELWTFIAKKEAHLTPAEQLETVYGDTWVWIAFSPMCKLVPAWVLGKRTLAHARRLVFRLKSAINEQLPYSPATNRRTMRTPLLEAFGEWVQPSRNSSRGPFPNPRRVPPPDLFYASVVKQYEKGRVVEVTTRIVYGTTIHQQLL